MKKIAVLAAIIFVISPQIFAGENPDEVERCFFSWQLYNHYSGNTLFEKTFENNYADIDFINSYARYLADLTPPSLLERIYSIDEKLGDYFYYQLILLKFFDNISGGSEQRLRERQEENRRYNILHPNEPPKRVSE